MARKLPPVYPTFYFEEIWVYSKIRVIFSETLSRTLGLKISPRQVDRVVELSDRTFDGQRVAAVCYTSVDRNVLTPLLRFVVDLLSATACSQGFFYTPLGGRGVNTPYFSSSTGAPPQTPLGELTALPQIA